MSIDRRPGTRLPDDPVYWEDLAARSVGAAFGATPAPGAMRAAEPWWRGMADAAFLLAASAVLALIGGSLLLEPRPPRPTTEARALGGSLAPEDPLLGSLVNIPAEPPPAALLRLLALREVER